MTWAKVVSLEVCSALLLGWASCVWFEKVPCVPDSADLLGGSQAMPLVTGDLLGGMQTVVCGPVWGGGSLPLAFTKFFLI